MRIYQCSCGNKIFFDNIKCLTCGHELAFCPGCRRITEAAFAPPLRFDFKADVIAQGDFWRSFGKTEKVYTGHDAGRITINIREADDVEREKLRVDMGESHRTLIGHFRHEIGHYY